MERAIKILVSGLALAAATVAVGQLLEVRYREQSLAGLVSECQQEANAAKASSDAYWRQFTMDCDPTQLSKGAMPPGVQGKIYAAHERLYSPSSRALLLGALVALAFSAPYLWYFFLRRVKELRDVLTGRSSA